MKSRSFLIKKGIPWLCLILCLVVYFPSVSYAVRLATEEGKPAIEPAPAEKKLTVQPAPTKPIPVKPIPVKPAPAREIRPERMPLPATEKTAPTVVQPDKRPPVPVVVAPSPAAPLSREPRYVTIDFDNVDIQIFIRFISELTGKNFVVDDKVRGRVTIVSPKRIHLDEVYRVFLSVLEIYGFTAVESGNIIKIMPALQARERRIQTLLQEEAPAIRDDRLVTYIVSLDHANPDEVKKVLDPLIARTSVIISYPPTGMLVITDFLSNIGRLKEIIAAIDVEGMATQISYLPLKFAQAADVAKSLTAIFHPLRAGAVTVRVIAEERTNSLIIMASEADAGRMKKLIGFIDRDVPRGDVTLRVFRLQNALAEDMAKVLMNIPRDTKDPAQKGRPTVLSREIHITPDKATNNLIITASRDDYRILEEIIKKLDQPRPMVYIEALLMEVGVNRDFRLGVEWRAAHDVGGVSGFDTGRTAIVAGSGGMGPGGAYNIIPGIAKLGEALAFPGGFALGVLGAGISIGGVIFPNIGAIIQAYQREADVTILSTPQILTMDNEEAKIMVGRNVPFLVRQERRDGVADVYFSQYEFRDVGITLNIVPHINEDGLVRMRLRKEVSTILEEESLVGLPTTLRRETKTTVTVRDRETVVIGGLMGDSTETGAYGVPWLSRIPILGWLFRSRSQRGERSNLYVFLTPHIVRTQADASELAKQKQKQMEQALDAGVIKFGGRSPARKPAPQPVSAPPERDAIPLGGN